MPLTDQPQRRGVPNDIDENSCRTGPLSPPSVTAIDLSFYSSSLLDMISTLLITKQTFLFAVKRRYDRGNIRKVPIAQAIIRGTQNNPNAHHLPR